MNSIISEVENRYKKPKVTDVRPGDSVRIHQKVKEGDKQRIQVFEGLVIRTRQPNRLTANFTVRRIASGVGVEKTFLSHSPLITKIEVTKRSKVRRNYLSYMRELTGKSSRLSGVEFDKDAVNAAAALAEAELEKIKAQQAQEHAEAEAKKAEAEAKLEAKAQAALAKHDEAQGKTEPTEATTKPDDQAKTDNNKPQQA